jgi:hypothetical protein
VARKAGKDRGITQRKGREGWWVRVCMSMEGNDGIGVTPRAKPRPLYGRVKAEQREGKYFEKAKAVPFREIAEEYLKIVDSRRSRKGDDHSRMKRWVSAFGDQDAATISARQIERVLAELPRRRTKTGYAHPAPDGTQSHIQSSQTVRSDSRQSLQYW